MPERREDAQPLENGLMVDQVPSDPVSRRWFLLGALAGLGGLLSGCGASQRAVRAMPGPVWQPRAQKLADRHRLTRPAPSRIESPPPAMEVSGVLPRSQWTSARADSGRMNRMTPIHSITVHHDGMQPYFDASESGTIQRLEAIRRAHRDRRQWGDIGYHFAVDRAGRIYECRSIIWQGAHVRNRNEGNIGVLALGNFDEQTPTEAQLAALRQHVANLQRRYRVDASNVRTHQEWQGAVTACPGRALQAYMDTARKRNMLG